MAPVGGDPERGGESVTGVGVPGASAASVGRRLTLNITTGPFYAAPPAPCGAVERIWFELAREFVGQGHQVRILSRGHEGYPASQVEHGIEIRRLWTFRQSHDLKLDLLKDMAFSARLLGAIPRADLTICNCFWLPAVISRFPGPWGKVYVSVARVPKGQMRLYTRAARIQAVSSAIEAWIVEQTPSVRGITRTIPNPIDVHAFRPGPGGVRRWLAGQPRTIVYTGRVHPEKGLHLLLRAFVILRAGRADLRLRIIGPVARESGGGGEEFLRSLRELAPGLGEPELTFSPAIYDRGLLAEALRESDLYCYPSVADKGEASPVAPLEAMGVGLVPVCSDMPQFRDYLQEGVNGVTFDHRSPDSHEKLAKVLGDLLDDPDRRYEMGLRAAATGAQYANAAIARRFLEDFYSLLQPP